jgi:uncharacterized protein (DUF2252 family)
VITTITGIRDHLRLEWPITITGMRSPIGDAHVENFGTWRDDEGRLVWGANDFDEASEIPYPFDLVRLAASARLARDLFMSGQETCAAILSGYTEGLANPRPAVLDEHHK